MYQYYCYPCYCDPNSLYQAVRVLRRDLFLFIKYTKFLLGPRYVALFTRVGTSWVTGASITISFEWIMGVSGLVLFLLVDRDLLQHTHWNTVLGYTLSSLMLVGCLSSVGISPEHRFFASSCVLAQDLTVQLFSQLPSEVTSQVTTGSSKFVSRFHALILWHCTPRWGKRTVIDLEMIIMGRSLQKGLGLVTHVYNF